MRWDSDSSSSRSAIHRNAIYDTWPAFLFDMNWISNISVIMGKAWGNGVVITVLFLGADIFFFGHICGFVFFSGRHTQHDRLEIYSLRDNFHNTTKIMYGEVTFMRLVI